MKLTPNTRLDASWRDGAAIAALLCLLSVSAGAAEKKDFDARWKEAQQTISGGAGEQYFTVLFVKEFFGKYAVHMTKCTQRTGEKVKGNLTAAVELGARGQVLAVLVRPELKVTKCFADLVKRDTFSPPPSAHFWLPVTIRFTEAPPPEQGTTTDAPEHDPDKPPVPLHMTQPRYPPAAFNNGISGTVELEILIDKTGRVAKARVVKSIPELDAAALQCVREWEFRPAQKGGQSVATVASAPITFTITKKK